MTIASVWAELWGVIAADPTQDDSTPVAPLTVLSALTGDPVVRRVYRGEPVFGKEPDGTWVTCTPAGLTADYVDLWLRVYRSVGPRPIHDQDIVAEAVDIIELLLDGQNRFEMGDWTIGGRQQMGDWVAEISLRGPRER